MRIEGYGEASTERVVLARGFTNEDGTWSVDVVNENGISQGLLFILTPAGLVLCTCIDPDLGVPLDDRGRIKIVE